MPDDLYKPGQKAPRSGQYEITGPRGGGTEVERTVTKGEPLPPTEQKGQKYRLVDPTKHKRKS
jgi:hypothetical protein